MVQLTAMTSKAYEIATLKRWAKQSGEGSYLHSLLNDGLVDWVEKQIWDDVSCDIWAILECEISNRQFSENQRRLAQENADNCQTSLARKVAERDEEYKGRADAELQLRHADKRISELQSKTNQLEELKGLLHDARVALDEQQHMSEQARLEAGKAYAEVGVLQVVLMRIADLAKHAWFEGKTVSPEQVREVLGYGPADDSQ